MPIRQDFIIDLTATMNNQRVPPASGRCSLAIVLVRMVRRRRDRARLDKLPDHLLRDIGISRSEIASITWFGGRDVTRRNSNGDTSEK